MALVAQAFWKGPNSVRWNFWCYHDEGVWCAHAEAHSLTGPPNESTISWRQRTVIKVQSIEPNKYRVTVEGSRTTTHTVSVSPSYYEKLTGKRVTPEILVEKSFEFLLQRESNTSILSSFDLPVIGRYFPEYENTIPNML